MFKNLTRAEKSWVLYDVGNSAFTMLACSLIPIWFKSLAIGDAPGRITGDQATAYYSIAIAVVTVNNDENPAGLWVRVPDAGEGDANCYTGQLTGRRVPVENGQIHVELPASSGEIWLPA